MGGAATIIEIISYDGHSVEDRMTKALSQTLYGLVGVLFLLAGVSVLLLGTGLLPSAVSELIVDLGQDNANTLHIMQEFASLLVFAGLITFWFVWHYEKSRPFHWAMTVFWGLVALVHWFDIRGSFHAGAGPVINTIPLVFFVVVGLLRQRARK
jgi:hypothetical protein